MPLPAEIAPVEKLAAGGVVAEPVVPMSPPFAYQLMVPVGGPGEPPPQVGVPHCGFQLAVYETDSP